MATSGFFFNLFYYKTLLLSKIFPDYTASTINDMYYTPRQIKQQEYEKDFEQKTKFNLIKVPTEGYIERIEDFNKRSKDIKITNKPKLPKEINVMEFLPEDNISKKEYSILCIHGWEGRGTNFYKFISKLTEKGFRVLCPDFPKHGTTEGEESGCHIFGHSINCIIKYFNTPIFFLVHSLGNGATCMSYLIGSDDILNNIKGFVGIGVPDKFTDALKRFAYFIGMDDYTTNIFLDKNTERLGIDVNLFVVSQVVSKFNFPVLIVHDENDKEIPIQDAENVSKNVKYQKYFIGDKEFSCFYKTKGLGHRRIIRDDGVVDVVCNFIADAKI